MIQAPDLDRDISNNSYNIYPNSNQQRQMINQNKNQHASNWFSDDAQIRLQQYLKHQFNQHTISKNNPNQYLSSANNNDNQLHNHQNINQVEQSDSQQQRSFGEEQNTQIQFYREYIGCQLQNLKSMSTITLPYYQNHPRLKQKNNLNWLSNPKIIPDVSTFYYVKFNAPEIDIYEILPSPSKYTIRLSHEIPIAIHIQSKVVFIILLGGDAITFKLGHQQIQKFHISQLQNIGCIYSIHTTYTEDKKQSLRIAYQNQGMRFFELSQFQSFKFNIFNIFKSNNYIHLIPVPPYNLIGFVITTTQQLKPINLHTKQLMDCQPIKLNLNSNIELFNLKFLIQPPEVFKKQGFILFLMVMYQTYSSNLKVYLVSIKHIIESKKRLNINDIVSGNIGNQMEMQLIMEFNQEQLIEDVVMAENGFFISYRQFHNSPVLKTNYRTYEDVLNIHPVERLQSQILKNYRQDSSYNTHQDIQIIKQRILNPNVFTIQFLRSNGLNPQQIYSKFKAAPIAQLKILFNRLVTARWPPAYKPIGIINMLGVIFVVRNNSISLLARNCYGFEQFEKDYYKSQVEKYQKIQNKNLVDDMKSLSISSNLQKLTSKRQYQNHLETPIQFIQIQLIAKQLTNPIMGTHYINTTNQKRNIVQLQNKNNSVHYMESLLNHLIDNKNNQALREQIQNINQPLIAQKQKRLKSLRLQNRKSSPYYKLLIALQTFFGYLSKYNEINNADLESLSYSIVQNVTLSQARHTIKILGTLMYKYYNDYQHKMDRARIQNHKNIMLCMIALNQIIHKPYLLYHSNYYNFYSNPNSSFTHYDLITYLVINLNKSNERFFNFSSFQSHDYLKLFKSIINRDIQLVTKNYSPDYLSIFNNSSQLLQYIVQNLQKQQTMKQYARIIYNANYTNITQHYLKICLLTQNEQDFSKKVMILISNYNLSCKFLKSLFTNDKKHYIYKKGRAIIEYLSLVSGQKITNYENLDFQMGQYRDILNSLIDSPSIEQEQSILSQRFKYFDKLSTKQKLNDIIQQQDWLNFKKQIMSLNNPDKNCALSRQILAKHCQIFNQLGSLDLKQNSIAKFIDKMFQNYVWGLESFYKKHKLSNVDEDERFENDQDQQLFLKYYSGFDKTQEIIDSDCDYSQVEYQSQVERQDIRQNQQKQNEILNPNQIESSYLVPSIPISSIQGKTSSEVKRLIDSQDQKSEVNWYSSGQSLNNLQQFRKNQIILQLQNKFLAGFKQFIYGRTPSYYLLYILKSCYQRSQTSKMIVWDDIPYYFLKQFIQKPLQVINLQVKKLLHYFSQTIVVRNLVLLFNRTINYKDISQLKTLQGYLGVDYCRRTNKLDKMETLLKMIQQEGKIFRSLNLESNIKS